jgi:hypothetical protein
MLDRGEQRIRLAKDILKHQRRKYKGKAVPRCARTEYARRCDLLTVDPHSAAIAPTAEQVALLRSTHGKDLEIWWNQRFVHGCDRLTQSEARYLERTSSEIVLLKQSKRASALRITAKQPVAVTACGLR